MFTIGNHWITGRVNSQDNVIIGCPIGTIVMWTSEQIPYGWRTCNGDSIEVDKVNPSDNPDYYENDPTFGGYYKCNDSRYSKLFHIIGFKFGNEQGGTNQYKVFKLPNFGDRFPYGATIGTTGTTGTTYSNIGVTGGTSSHTLTRSEIQHAHYISSTTSDKGTKVVQAGSTVQSTTDQVYGIGSDSVTNPDRTPFSILPPYTSVLFIIKFM